MLLIRETLKIKHLLIITNTRDTLVCRTFNGTNQQKVD